jgi:transcriptional regulator
MYHLEIFKDKDQTQLLDFMHQHPFALITGVSSLQTPVATQVPVLVKPRADGLYLQAHIMKHTDHHLAFEQNPEVLVVFTGADTYVSASWYVNPQQASTWNYQSVHARGTLRFLNDAELLQVLEETTTRFENNPNSPAAFNRLSENYVQRLSRAIIALEIKVTALDHIFKLSQNRDRQSFENIIGHLEQGNANQQAIAQAMQQRKETLYGT